MDFTRLWIKQILIWCNEWLNNLAHKSLKSLPSIKSATQLQRGSQSFTKEYAKLTLAWGLSSTHCFIFTGGNNTTKPQHDFDILTPRAKPSFLPKFERHSFFLN